MIRENNIMLYQDDNEITEKIETVQCAMPAGATLPKLTAATGNCKHICILCKFASGFKNRS